MASIPSHIARDRCMECLGQKKKQQAMPSSLPSPAPMTQDNRITLLYHEYGSATRTFVLVVEAKKGFLPPIPLFLS